MGVLNIMLIWIERGEEEPFTDDRLETLSNMPYHFWIKYEDRVREHLDHFYDVFIPYWRSYRRNKHGLSLRAIHARKKLSENRLARKLNVASLDSVKLSDPHEAFSHQPHKLERIHEIRQGETAIPPKEIVLPPLARRKSPSTIEFKPGLKDV